MPLGFTRHSNRSQRLDTPPQTLQQQQHQHQQQSQQQQPQPQLSPAAHQQHALLQQQILLQQQQQQQQRQPQQSAAGAAADAAVVVASSAAENEGGYDPSVTAKPQPPLPPQHQPQPQQQQQPYPSTADDLASYSASQVDQRQQHQQTSGSAYHELTQNQDVLPSRSRSHRFSTSYLHITGPSSHHHHHPPQNTANPAPFDAPSSKTSAPLPGELKKSSTSGPGAPLQPPEPHKKSKSRNFFQQFSSKNSSSSSSSGGRQQPQPSLKSPAANLGRKISKRNNESPTETAPPQQQQQLQHNNSSIERLQQPDGWQSNKSSGTLSSPQEEEDDGLDPYLIRDKETEHQASGYDPRLGLTVRVVADSHLTPQQYQQFQEQQVQSPQQYSPQQYQLNTQLNAPLVSEDQPLDYASQVSTQQSAAAQYQHHQQQQQSLGSYVSQNQQYRNPEVISQVSHDSPLEPTADDLQRPPSVQSSQGYATQQQYPSRTGSSSQEPRATLQHQSSSSMGPPAQQGSQSRKSTDKSMQIDSRAAPPGYTQGQFAPPNQGSQTALQSPLPPLPTQQQQQQQQQQPPSGYRNSQLRGDFGPDGRSTPPLQESRELTEMEKLLIKYKKVKGLYFDKQAQVEQLQNTLANQRLSQSRTSLDDSEYITRFQRLDGAIKEVAFSIRKDWKVLPHWLSPFVNPSALQTGTKEMTAVGRATISRWLADEIFGKCFHPGLDMGFSTELKRVEQNVRFFAAPPPNQEEADALTAKIIQWRLTTMEGLAYRLNSAHAAQAKADFIQMAVSNLTAHLLNHLHDAADHGFQGNATSIVELAVGIASHLPCESRDIVVSYPLPGDLVAPYMKVEAALPALEIGVDAKADDAAGGAAAGGAGGDAKDEDGKGEKGKKDGGKGSLKKMPPGAAAAAASSAAAAAEQQQQQQQGQGQGGEVKDGSNNIRYAGFVGVEVRGRQWLYNPPVWTIS